MRRARKRQTGLSKVVQTPFGDALKIPVDHFLNVFLPPLDPAHTHKLKNIETYLKKDKVEKRLSDLVVGYQLVTTKKRLWGFQDAKPSSLTREAATSRLQGVITKLSSVFLSAKQRRKLAFSRNKNTITRHNYTDDVNEATVLPDAYVATSMEPLDWSDIVVSGVLSHNSKRTCSSEVRDSTPYVSIAC